MVAFLILFIILFIYFQYCFVCFLSFFFRNARIVSFIDQTFRKC